MFLAYPSIRVAKAYNSTDVKTTSCADVDHTPVTIVLWLQSIAAGDGAKGSSHHARPFSDIHAHIDRDTNRNSHTTTYDNGNAYARTLRMLTAAR